VSSAEGDVSSELSVERWRSRVAVGIGRGIRGAEMKLSEARKGISYADRRGTGALRKKALSVSQGPFFVRSE